jgi:hypothetical protein
MLELFQIPHTSVPVLHATRRLTGFVSGTLIRTADGDLPVEFIGAGDRVLTRERGLVTVQGVSVVRARDMDVVHIAAGTYGNPRPLTLPAAQQVLVQDWRAAILEGAERMLTSAGSLVDGGPVRRETVEDLRLYKLHLNATAMIWAEGIETATGVIRRTPAKPRRPLH